MRKSIIFYAFLFFIGCAVDVDYEKLCPPYESIDSKGIPDRHLKILNCAGYKDYVISQVEVVYFVNEFPGQPKRILWACQECGFIAIVNYSRKYYTEQEAVELECWCLVNGAYFLLNGTYDGSDNEGEIFRQNLIDNDCQL